MKRTLIMDTSETVYGPMCPAELRHVCPQHCENTKGRFKGVDCVLHQVDRAVHPPCHNNADQ